MQKTMRTWFYMVSVVLIPLAGTLLFIFGVVAVDVRPHSHLGEVLVTLALPLLLYGGVLVTVYVWRIWKTIQEEDIEMTPGAAVFLALIPVVNVWTHSYYYSKRFNQYVARHQLKVPLLNSRIFFLHSLTATLSIFVPLLLVSAPLWAYVVYSVCKGVNAIRAETQGTAD